ncbi:hypothetical protein TNCV_2871671 [Trichonephila clavipes]|nr:hypothetical protein TNCV_2871671 [Trichonephila clavipes]
MSEYQGNAIKTPAACMKTVSEDRVQLCGHNKSISFLNEDGVSRQGKVMREHPKQKWFPRQGLALRGTEEVFGSPHNGNFMGALELLDEFDPFICELIEQREYYDQNR